MPPNGTSHHDDARLAEFVALHEAALDTLDPAFLAKLARVLLSAKDNAAGGNSPLQHIEIRCLGPFHLKVDGFRVERWRARKIRALFQYLVAHRERPVSRDQLIEALWSCPDASTPGTSLKVAVHSLRQLLNEAGILANSISVQANEVGYMLSAPRMWLDVEEFESCFDAGRRFDAVGQYDEAQSSYRRAADLYQGDFLEESWDDWAVFRRESLRDRFLFVIARLAEMALASGDYQECILRCQQLLEKDRCREDSYRALMVCHSRLGQRGRVRSWYELCLKTLKNDLDVDPDQDTARTYRLSLRGEA